MNALRPTGLLLACLLLLGGCKLDPVAIDLTGPEHPASVEDRQLLDLALLRRLAAVGLDGRAVREGRRIIFEDPRGLDLDTLHALLDTVGLFRLVALAPERYGTPERPARTFGVGDPLEDEALVTIFQNGDVTGAAPEPDSHRLSVTLTPEADIRLTDWSLAHPDEFVCLLIDERIFAVLATDPEATRGTALTFASTDPIMLGAILGSPPLPEGYGQLGAWYPHVLPWGVGPSTATPGG